MSVNDPSPAIHLSVRGMTCAACVSRVERALGKVPGVARAQVNFATEVASVNWTPDASAPDANALVDAVRKAGYEAHEQAADAAVEEEALPWWQVWGPALMGLAAGLPLLAPMLAGQHHLCRRGSSSRWPRPCSSSWVRASTKLAGPRSKTAAATWTNW